MNLRVIPSDDDLDMDVEPGVLAGLEVAARFHFWRGHSGRRYVFSVFGLDDHAAFERAVVVAVKRGQRGRRRPLWVGVLGGEDWYTFAAAAADVGADEIHAHLLAGDEEARARVVDDLDPRHRRSFPAYGNGAS